MADLHEANRRWWDRNAASWRELRDRDSLWKRCPEQPELAFEGEVLHQIRASLGELARKRICVIGSGDNYAVFALAGCGARVTSVDISQQQLDVAQDRAKSVGLEIAFVRADAADLTLFPESSYDLVVSTNGFFVWISAPGKVFAAVFRILRPGGFYIFCDIHPFQRPWANQVQPLEMEKPYWDTGPHTDETADPTYEFNWTLADLINPLVGSGLVLKGVLETAAESSRFWQDVSYEPGTNEELLDWKKNPRAGLPVWLTVTAQKPARPQEPPDATAAEDLTC
jgi:SAM-dependent methyltransferase